MAEPMISGLVERLASITQLELGLLEDAKGAVKRFSRNLVAVRAVVVDADKIQYLSYVEAKDSVREWINKLQDFCYEADHVLDEWNTQILKSQTEDEEDDHSDFISLYPSKKECLFCVPTSCSRLSQLHDQVVLHRHIALKIKELNEKLDEIAAMKDVVLDGLNKTIVVEAQRKKSTFLVNDYKSVYGRDDDKERLIRLLLKESSKDEIVPNIIHIVGMAGIGKTTLARHVYRDKSVTACFKYKIWVQVGDPFDWGMIAKAIIKAIGGNCAPELYELESLSRCVEEFIEGKKFLLVLDDVWTIDEMKWLPLWGSLRHGDVDSRILVTTRNEQVAMMMGTTQRIHLNLLSEDNYWRLFFEQAFAGRQHEHQHQMVKIGSQIAKRCEGLPFLAQTLATHLCHKRLVEEWEDVLKKPLWELADVKDNVFAPLLLSYHELSTLEKHCLLYFSIFPTNYEIDKDDLIEMWMSQGYLIDSNSLEIGENCCRSLTMRSFFQEYFIEDYLGKYTPKLKMHGILHGFLQFLAGSECSMTKLSGTSTREEIYQGTKISRHCTLPLKYSIAQIPNSIYDKKKLRTLFVRCTESATPLNLDLIPELTCLRTLYLSGCGIEKLPTKIDKLMYLRYLNLSDNFDLKELPSKLCNLINLQTLKLNYCFELQNLPDGMGKLVNLRHLYIDGCDKLEELPKGIGRLASLETLDMLVAPSCDIFKSNKAMQLGDLNRLELVKGYLHIREIGNVTDVGDAEKARLRNKQNLVSSKLDFTGPQRTTEESEVLLEALQPQPNLRSLEITKYQGVNVLKVDAFVD